MVLDSEVQRSILLGIIDASTFAGQALDQIFMVKQSIIQATVQDTEQIPLKGVLDKDTSKNYVSFNESKRLEGLTELKNEKPVV